MSSQIPGNNETPVCEKISSEEYARRKIFLENLKSLTKPEYVEIVRILKKNEVGFSENQNGIFFNVAHLPQVIFDELETFIQFTHTNRQNLSDRDTLLSTLRKI